MDLPYRNYAPFSNLFQWSRNPERLPGIFPFRSVHSISAVVPTLNEAKLIANCIASLVRQAEIGEVIVADGGSKDDTVAVSKAGGAQVVRCDRPGRGFQIREGIEHARGDVILVVHADCRLIKGAARKIRNALNKDSFLAGGAFRMAFASPDIRQRIISGLNNLRSRATGISFGDQGQFARNEALDRIGGFPDQMLMEDVELSLRLRQVGRLVFLPKGILASSRRWETQPFTRGVARVVHLFSRYLLERRTGRIHESAKDYHSRYYGE